MAVFKSFTLDNYSALFRDSVLLPSIKFGYTCGCPHLFAPPYLERPAAIGITAWAHRLRRATMALTNIPLTNPEIVTSVSLALLFAFMRSYDEN